MSNAYLLANAGNLPPVVPTSFVTDVNPSAVPVANVLNVIGGETTANNNNGIRTDGSSGSDTLTVQLTNRGTGTATTTDDTLTTIITFPLGATPGVYFIEGDFIGYDVTDVAGGVYGFQAAFRTTGAAAVEISTEYKDVFEEAAMSTSDIFVAGSGNNVLFQVQGITAKTIDWSCMFTYRLVT